MNLNISLVFSLTYKVNEMKWGSCLNYNVYRILWLSQVINSNNQRQPTAVIEEIIVEDATVPQQVAQEIIIKGGNITHISAGPYNGYLQGPL